MLVVARCPSVRQSVNLVRCIQTAIDIVRVLSESGIAPSFWFLETFRIYAVAIRTPSAGALHKRGVEKFV